MNIVFDLDGTLFNTFVLHHRNMKTVATKFMGEPVSAAKILQSSRSTVSWQMKVLVGEKHYRNAMEEYTKMFNEEVNNGLLTDQIDICGFLQQLNRLGVSVSIFTGRNYQSTCAILKYFMIDHLFSQIVCYSEEHFDKCESFYTDQIFHSDTIYITDSLEEVSCFASLGIDIYFAQWFRQIMVSPKLQQVNTLEQLNAILLEKCKKRGVYSK